MRVRIGLYDPFAQELHGSNCRISRHYCSWFYLRTCFWNGLTCVNLFWMSTETWDWPTLGFESTCGLYPPPFSWSTGLCFIWSVIVFWPPLLPFSVLEIISATWAFSLLAWQFMAHSVCCINIFDLLWQVITKQKACNSNMLSTYLQIRLI